MSAPAIRGREPVFLRQSFYGRPGSGKSLIPLTYPAPIAFHPAPEGGWETYTNPVDGSSLCPVVVLGREHASFCRTGHGSTIDDELMAWVDLLDSMARGGPLAAGLDRRPQTVILGGFSVVLQMMLAKGEWLRVGQLQKKNPKAKGDMQKAWGDVLEFSRKLFHYLLSLPMHVVVEINAKEVYSNDPQARGELIGYEPDVQGQSKAAVFGELRQVLYQQRSGQNFTTWFEEAPQAVGAPGYAVKNSYNACKGWRGVQNLCYDHFVEPLGLPPIWEADPQHPRCIPGRWPWDVHSHA